MKYSFVLLSFLVMNIAFSAFSQAKKWTVKECIEVAISNNLTSPTKSEIVNNTTAGETPANNTQPTLNEVNEIGLKQLESGNTATSVYSLETNLKVLDNSQAEIKKKAFEQKDQEAARKEISLNVLNAYLKILFDIEQIEMMNSHMNIALEQLRLTEVLVKEGKQTKQQLLQLESQLGNDKLALISIIGDLSSDQISLMMIMNIPLVVDFEIEKIKSAESENLALVRPQIPNEVSQDDVALSSQRKTALQKQQLNNAKQLEQRKKTSLRKEIEEVYSAFEVAQEKYQNSLYQFNNADESYKNLQSDFNAGMITAGDLGVEKDNYLKAQTDMLQAKYQLILNKETLEFYQKGTLSL